MSYPYIGGNMANTYWLAPVTSANQLSGADLIPVFVQNSGSQRSVSMSIFTEWLRRTFASPDMATQFVTPGTGSNIAVTYNGSSVWLLMQPASGLATSTITLPLASSTADGTEVLVTTTQQVTTLTVAANGASAVYGAPSSLGADDVFRMRFYQPTNAWYKVQ